MAWVPVVIETGRDALQFDLVLRGDPVDDFFVFGIGESNLFTMSAAYIPAECVSSGPLFDLSAWSGEAVD